VVGTAPPPADELVEVADKSVVPAEEFVVLPDELVVGAEELVVVDVSDDEVASNVSLVPEAAWGQMPSAIPSIGIIKTLRAFKFPCMMSFDRAKNRESESLNRQSTVSSWLNLSNVFLARHRFVSLKRPYPFAAGDWASLRGDATPIASVG